MPSSSDVLGAKACPCCGKHVFRSSHEGTRVYKCANPVSSCRWNREMSDVGSEEYARTPLGKTIAQVRRAHAELANEVSNRDVELNGVVKDSVDADVVKSGYLAAEDDDESSIAHDEKCDWEDVVPYEPEVKAVKYCPACGAHASHTGTPTEYKCTNSGETFYVER